MRKTLNTIFILILTFMFFLRVDAIDVPSNVQLVNSSENSLEINWDSVPKALWYYVRYSKNPWTTSWFEWDDLVETNFVELNLLQEKTPYYVYISSVDENWEESVLSDEFMFSTKGNSSNVEEFKLTSIEVIAFNKLKLMFNMDLEQWDNVIREFKIVNKKDEFDELDIMDYEVDEERKNELILILEQDAVWNEEYELTVIAIRDKNNRNIELWIDSVENFTIPEFFENEDNIWLKSAEEPEIINKPEIVKEPEVIIDEPEVAKEPEEKSVNLNEVSINNNKKLPDTWPEHIIILVLAFLAWMLIFIFKYKKA